MNRQSRGRADFGPRFEPQYRYLLDNPISPRLALALRQAHWDSVSVNELFRVEPNESVPDEEIIPRCAQEGRAWITLDVRARWQHAAALRQHLVSTLWIQPPSKDGMSAAYLLAVLARALPKFDGLLTRRRYYAIHYAITSGLEAQPKKVWEQRRPRP